MAKNIPIFIVAAGEDTRPAGGLQLPVAYLVYTIGPGGALVRADLPGNARGGLLGLSDYSAPAEGLDGPRLCRELLAECSHRGYGGILLDFENPTSAPLCSGLSQMLSHRNVPHYVPLPLAMAAPGARVLIPSAISGGSFAQMLGDFCNRFGPQRLALEVVRVCAQYPMPAYNPDGKSLDAQEFQQLLQEYDPTCFFSKELCAKYFTYRNQSGETFFVLYDDLASTSQKIQVAAQMGFCGAFVLYRDFGQGCRQLV